MIKQFEILGSKKRTVLYRSSDKRRFEYVIMQPITIEEEQDIERSKEETDHFSFYPADNVGVYDKNIFCYGSIDFHNEDDIKVINDANILDMNIMNKSDYIPKYFDYENGIIATDEKGILISSPTWNKIEWFKYNYCLLGKPERVIIYKVDAKDYSNILKSDNIC